MRPVSTKSISNLARRALWPLIGLAAALAVSAVPARAGDVVPLEACTGAAGAADALRACSKLLDRTDLDAATRRQVLIRRAAAWLSEDEPKDAISDYTHSLDLVPGDIEALTGRARAETTAGEHAKAAEDWTLIIAKHAGNLPLIEAATLERAASYRAAGNADAALADYAKLLELNPKSIKAHIGRAAVHDLRGDRAKALEAFAQAMAIEPENTAPYIARAEAAERWGDTRMAIEDYSFVVRNNSRSAGPYRQALKRLGVDTPP